jgi:GTP-binding protein YchF
MGLTIGIVGLPNAGKSTIFNALSRGSAPTAGYPFTTIEPNTGTVALPDERLLKIAEITKPEKITPATVEFTDVAGLVRGASHGEGLGNQFLGHIRNVSAILHVARCFVDENVAHPEGDIDPRRDIEIIETELILADLQTVEKRKAKVEKVAQSGDKEARAALAVYTAVLTLLDAGTPAKEFRAENKDEEDIFHEMNLLSAKPVLFAANIDEAAMPDGNELSDMVLDIARKKGSPAVVISGKIESEIAELTEDERSEYLRELGLTESGLSHVIREGYGLLLLITFYTTVGPELRAWSIPAGTPAREAAGKIHSDMEKGFIKAEVLSFSDLVDTGSEQKAREDGKMRIEGKEYIVCDGDVVKIRFNP